VASENKMTALSKDLLHAEINSLFKCSGCCMTKNFTCDHVSKADSRDTNISVF